MGLLDGVLGGVVGAGLTTVVAKMVEEHGGLQGVVSKLEQGGLGETVKSWIGMGDNKPVSGPQIHTALGQDTIGKLAAQLNMSPQELSDKLAQILPQAVDKATPNGVLPS